MRCERDCLQNSVISWEGWYQGQCAQNDEEVTAVLHDLQTRAVEHEMPAPKSVPDVMPAVLEEMSSEQAAQTNISLLPAMLASSSKYYSPDDLQATIDSLVSPIARERDHAQAIDCSRHADASVQTEMLSAGTSAEQPPDRGACFITGGPLSLDSVLVYTKEEMGRICDALVEPLANAIHSLDDIDSLLSCSSSVADAEVSLGALLRDICSKFVPLTAALDAKQQAAEQFRARHAGRMQTSKEPSSKNEGVECHKCPQCFRTFTNAAILKVHLNSHAESESDTELKDQVVQSCTTADLSGRSRMQGINKRGMAQPKRKHKR